jgi:DNA polymerase-3 subunit delta'
VWDGVRGHSANVAAFRRAVGRNRLAHAYLLVGPQGVGKRLFARKVAQCLFCTTFADADLEACGTCPSCRQVLVSTHPDLLEIGCPPGKTTLPISLIRGEDSKPSSGLCYQLELSPMQAPRRIAIVDDAELMNDESANAFLKTLEEPPPGAVIFMLATDLDRIMPTIRSRCQPLQFTPLATTDITTLLMEQQLVTAPQQAQEIAQLAEGSMAVARELLEPEVRQLRSTVAKHLQLPQLQPLAAVEEVLAALEALGNETATQRLYAGWVVRFAVEELRGKAAAAGTESAIELIGSMQDRCLEAVEQLKQFTPVPLCLEALFDGLARLQRGNIQPPGK